MYSVSVLGAGESGMGAALLAKKMGFKCLVSDAGCIKPSTKSFFDDNDIHYEEEGHTDLIYNANLCVKSPGIPDSAPVVQKMIDKGIVIISEIEFAFRFTDSYIIAVTGSNGKTTTSSLIYHILKEAGKDVGLCGNIGYSFAKQLAVDTKQIYVIELSSFQLDNIKTFKPDIAVLLNITADHLDRYNYKESLYAAAKWKIVKNLETKNLLIVNDNLIIPDHIESRVVKLKQDNKSLVKYKGEELNLAEMPLKGQHNIFNMSVAVKVALELGLSLKNVKEGLKSFKSIEHRLEFVRNYEGIEYINDSKATNIDAVLYALDAMVKPIVWIVGGIDKGNDYAMLDALVENKVKAIVCLGKDNSLITSHFKENGVPIVEADNASLAVSYARSLSDYGDVVLLSPACSSFDLFENYEQRGRFFKKAVNALI